MAQTNTHEATQPTTGQAVGARLRPAWLCQVTGEPVTREACFACARDRLRPACPFNIALLKALDASRQPDEALMVLDQLGYPTIRATSLTGCPRKAWYSRTEGRPLETPGQHWARLRGTIFHEALAGMGEGIVERRLAAIVRDGGLTVIVSGRVDGYDPETNVLYDYKTTNISGLSGKANGDGRTAGGLHLPLPSHVRQLWVYAWLLVRNGFPIPAAIRVIYMNMKEVCAVDAPAPLPTPQAGDPPLPASSQRPPTIDEIERAVARRVKVILADEPPPARPDEAWECRYCPFSQCPRYDGSRDGR